MVGGPHCLSHLCCDELHTRTMRQIGSNRRALFEAIEQPSLLRTSRTTAVTVQAAGDPDTRSTPPYSPLCSHWPFADQPNDAGRTFVG